MSATAPMPGPAAVSWTTESGPIGWADVLHIFGDDVGKNFERRAARLANVDSGELGEVVRQREVLRL